MQPLTQALRSNPRIDGLYLYVSTSTPDLLAERQKQRLAEAASTLSKRLAWAKQQVAKSASPGLFDNIIPNTGFTEVSRCCQHNQPSKGLTPGDKPCGSSIQCGLNGSCVRKCLRSAVNRFVAVCFRCRTTLLTGVWRAEGGHQQAQPHHPQQAEGPACLRAGLLGPDPPKQVCELEGAGAATPQGGSLRCLACSRAQGCC